MRNTLEPISLIQSRTSEFRYRLMPASAARVMLEMMRPGERAFVLIRKEAVNPRWEYGILERKS